MIYNTFYNYTNFMKNCKKKTIQQFSHNGLSIFSSAFITIFTFTFQVMIRYLSTKKNSIYISAFEDQNSLTYCKKCCCLRTRNCQSNKNIYSSRDQLRKFKHVESFKSFHVSHVLVESSRNA